MLVLEQQVSASGSAANSAIPSGIGRNLRDGADAGGRALSPVQPQAGGEPGGEPFYFLDEASMRRRNELVNPSSGIFIDWFIVNHGGFFACGSGSGAVAYTEFLNSNDCKELMETHGAGKAEYLEALRGANSDSAPTRFSQPAVEKAGLVGEKLRKRASVFRTEVGSALKDLLPAVQLLSAPDPDFDESADDGVVIVKCEHVAKAKASALTEAVKLVTAVKGGGDINFSSGNHGRHDGAAALVQDTAEDAYRTSSILPNIRKMLHLAFFAQLPATGNDAATYSPEQLGFLYSFWPLTATKACVQQPRIHRSDNAGEH
eukprot:TRINITY_DN2209_c0_g1_i3.p1 TRINITY_DN2209_c0_g1~~TRINITY_DN2209_c0_g1_i3.p1  ORF type:complete len:317 (-),score=60.67 TRINITY_DN2209_c0_g1_i3:1093-2043(-)